ncbi:MAG: flagellar motor switch protein FliG, partial [Rubrivirga sp.]
MTETFPDTLTGLQRAAVLVVALGVETAAQFLPSLSDDEIEKLSVEIARLDQVPGAIVADVLDAFQATDSEITIVPASGGLEAARAVIGQLDQDRASIIEPRMLAATEGTGFDIAATK